MKESFRQSMAWLHTWSGLLPGWILYFIFVTGTLGYFDDEIDRWMQPERPIGNKVASAEHAITAGIAALQKEAPDAQRWLIFTNNERINSDIMVGSHDGPVRIDYAYVDPTTLEKVETRETGGAQLLYQMHYLLHYLPRDVAYWIVGIASMAMLIALITGVIIHKRIFKDFFTLRFGKGQRSWLDAHNVVSVMSLPFLFMITYSGLVFLMFNYMPLILKTNFDNQQDFYSEIYARSDIPMQRSGEPADTLPPSYFLEQGNALAGSERLILYNLWHPGDRNARVVLSYARNNPESNTQQIIFDGVSGELISNDLPERLPPRKLNDLLLGLHEGLFAGTLLRWLYFLSGLLGTAMIATGLVLWVVKRSRSKAGVQSNRPAGVRFTERMNLAVLAGLPIAIVGYLHANRLLPVGMEDRMAMEANAMFGLWLLIALYTLFRPRQFVARDVFVVGAMICLALPVVNVLTSQRHLGITLINGDWALAGVDLGVLACAALFAVLARRAHQKLETSSSTGSSLKAVHP